MAFLAGLGAGLAQGIAGAATAVGQGVVGAAQAAGPAIAEAATTIGKGALDVAQGVGRGAGEVIGGLGQNVADIPGRAADLFTGIVDVAPQGLSSAPQEFANMGFQGLPRSAGNVVPEVGAQAAQVGPQAMNVPRVVSQPAVTQVAQPVSGSPFEMVPSSVPPYGSELPSFEATPLRHYGADYGPEALDIPPGGDGPMRYVGKWFDVVGEDGKVDPKKLMKKFGSLAQSAGGGAGQPQGGGTPLQPMQPGPTPQYPGPLFPPGYFM